MDGGKVIELVGGIGSIAAAAFLAEKLPVGAILCLVLGVALVYDAIKS